jgi:glycosyltransferase involved in cell wall biosynthesis
MACGLPVITTYCSPAVDDIVENNVNGIICDNDKFNLTNAIVSLINSPDLQQKIGENAKLISRKYSIDNITKKWEDVLKECVV